jgi:hypothetical protein
MKTILLFEFFILIQTIIIGFIYQVIWKSWKDRKHVTKNKS